jgi:hypothetical protein
MSPYSEDVPKYIFCSQSGNCLKSKPTAIEGNCTDVLDVKLKNI